MKKLEDFQECFMYMQNELSFNSVLPIFHQSNK